MENGELRAGDGLKEFIDKKLPIEHITFTSDGNGSMPRFDANGRLDGVGICEVSTLYREVKHAIKENKRYIDAYIQIAKLLNSKKDYKKIHKCWSWEISRRRKCIRQKN